MDDDDGWTVEECKEMEMEMEMLMGDGDDGQTVFGGIGKRKRSGHRAHRTQESHSRLALHLLDEMIGWRNAEEQLVSRVDKRTQGQAVPLQNRLPKSESPCNK